MKRSEGVFLTIEGIEGAGKSTLVEFIKDQLTQKNIPFIATREPGGTPIAEQLRQLLLHHSAEKIYPETELLLLFAGRSQHIHEVIQPALDNNQWVICDRFIDATYAYQGGGRQMDTSMIKILEDFTLKNLQPDVTLLLDLSEETGLARIKSRDSKIDRFEQEKIEFFKRVRKVYLERAQAEPHRFHIIDASLPLPQIQKNILFILNEILKPCV